MTKITGAIQKYLTLIDRDQNDPVFHQYQEMLKNSSENNWANNILDLRRKYTSILKDKNISNMSKPVWKSIVNRQIQYNAFNFISYSVKLCIFIF